MKWLRRDFQEGGFYPTTWVCWGFILSLEDEPRILELFLQIRVPLWINWVDQYSPIDTPKTYWRRLFWTNLRGWKFH